MPYDNLVKCPICLEQLPKYYFVPTPCNHLFCASCLESYFCMKANDVKRLNTYNPFPCPVQHCRQAIPVLGFVKQYLPPQLMDNIRKWYKDVKNPPCASIAVCMKKDCTGTMRQEARESNVIFCDVCLQRWCELCLQRVPMGGNHEGTSTRYCKKVECQQFCEKYLSSNDAVKAKCELKFPWIKLYAISHKNDSAAKDWVNDNGQICPCCRTGIERTTGCSHMRCYNCGTNFCYDCGGYLYYTQGNWIHVT
jgi:E3 ubiquitin-protein ligase RNF14